MANPEGEGDAGAGANAVSVGTDQARLSYFLFRRPDKYRIGEDFNLFVKKLNLYFEAVELEDQKKRRLTLLFSLSDDAFRLAESVDFPDGDNGYVEWTNQLKVLFERNQTQTEKRYSFNRRVQEPGASVDSYAVALREFGSKCGFKGDEYTNRLVDQFILGIKDRSTQNKLLQEPPSNLEDALSVARRFEAANATMQKLKAETFEASQPSGAQIGAVGSSGATKVCFNCNGYGHVAKQCPSWQNFNRESSGPNRNKICYRCNKTGHSSRNCYANQPSSSSVNTPVSFR